MTEGADGMSDFKKEYPLWDEFLRVWPLARLTTMTLDGNRPLLQGS